MMYFGQDHGLDFQRLLGASTYKEAYRRDMILWGEEKRQADPGFFCRKIVEGVSQPIWVSGLHGSINNTGFPSPLLLQKYLRCVLFSVCIATPWSTPPPSPT